MELTWRQIVRHDYYSGLGVFLGALYPIFLLISPIIGFIKFKGNQPLAGLVFSTVFSAVLMLPCLLLTWLRIRKLQEVCELGRIVEGKVVANFYSEYRDKPPSSYPGGGMLSFEFDGDQELRIALWRTRACERIDAGDPIRLAVHSRDPLLAIPVDLFREAN